MRGKLIGFEQPRIMGVLNVTTDSFYSGSRINSIDQAVKKAETMIADGADFVDIGASSSRPGSVLSNPSDEWTRLEPILKAVRRAHPEVWISVDTYHSLVAKNAIGEGADMINDISCGRLDENLMPWIIENQVPYIMMHMQGLPSDMQKDPRYGDAVAEILYEMASRISGLRKAGLVNIIVDPGFGFGKTLEHNYQILKSLNEWSMLNAPILVGVSRKSMVTKLLNVSADDALNGTTALHMLLLSGGAHILRVHDVKQASEAVRIFIFAKQT